MAGGLGKLAAFSLLVAGKVAGFDVDGCTSIAVGGGATVDGSVMTSHSNDCVDCDWRMVYVPAKDHKKGSLRPVLDASRSAYPRLVDPGRSKQYQPDLGFESSTVLGYVPQVEHTYGLWEASYAMMNEKGLTIGESTCAAYLVGNVTDGTGVKENEHEYKHGALFTIGNLIAIALERCETARCAVQTMGDLGSKYGFYGEDPGQPGAGEAATVADASGETWVFHISGGLPDKEGAKYEGQLGSLWAAQRVPDENVAVVANNFVIRKVDKHDTKNFMVHPGLFELAQEAGLWSGEGDFDFLKVMAPDMRHFSYTPGLPPIPLYTTLRMWHVFNAVAPSLAIEITDCAWDLPFSVPVDKKLSHLEVMDLFRTHYEGTEFDMRLGVAAGPYGSPNRAEGGMGMAAVPGQFARATSIPRTSYTQVGQTGIAHPKLWFAPDASASSIFVPFYASVLAHGDGEFDVASYGEGSSKSFDFAQEVKPAWWAFDFVANWMDKSYLNMSETYVLPRRVQLQQEVADGVVSAERKAASLDSHTQVAKALGAEQRRIQRHVSRQWWDLAGMLIVRYNDDFFNFPEGDEDACHTVGYPAWWLEMIGFGARSFFPTWVVPSATVPSLLPLKDKQSALASRETRAEALAAQSGELRPPMPASAAAPQGQLILAALVGMLATGVAGFHLGRRSAEGEADRSDYIRIAA